MSVVPVTEATHAIKRGSSSCLSSFFSFLSQSSWSRFSADLFFLCCLQCSSVDLLPFQNSPFIFTMSRFIFLLFSFT